MLAPVTEAWPGEEELLDLGLESLQRWPGFAADARRRRGSGRPACASEGTVVAATGARRPRRARLARRVPRRAGPARSTSSPAASCAGSNRRSAPTCGAGCPCRATLPSTTGRPLAALQAACERAGVALVRARGHVDRHGRRPGDGGPPSHRTDDIAADVVLLCAGAYSAAVAPRAGRAGAAGQGRDRPARPPRHRAATARAHGARPSSTGGRSTPCPATTAGLVVGATQYEAGFDTDVTVGRRPRPPARRRAGAACGSPSTRWSRRRPGCGPAARTTGR